jgi:hypothetical protein
VGVAGVSLAASLDDPIRRVFYGRAGEYRLPTYGIEYRVLSNFWLCAPPIAHLVLDLARNTISFALQGYTKLLKTTPDEVCSIINNCDVEKARALIKKHRAIYSAILGYCYTVPTTTRALHVLENGVETVVDFRRPLELQWNLRGTEFRGAWRFRDVI